jgi:hypothetical protein
VFDWERDDSIKGTRMSDLSSNAKGGVMSRRLVACTVILLFTASVLDAQVSKSPGRGEVLTRAKAATWAVAVLQYTGDGQVEYAALLGSGFFISPNHFVTADHVLNAAVPPLARRGPNQQFRLFKTDLKENGFRGSMKIVYENTRIDIAILESSMPVANWLSVTCANPAEGDEIGTYGYSLADFSVAEAHMRAFALLRLGVVAGYGLSGNIRRMTTTLGSATGNSGGPEFLMATGDVVAVHKGQLVDPAGTDVSGYSISTPLSAITDQLKALHIGK